MSRAKSKVNLNVVPFKRRPPMAKQDFTVEHRGSIVLLRPNTPDGIDWANAKIGKTTVSSLTGRRLFWSRATSLRSSMTFIKTG